MRSSCSSRSPPDTRLLVGSLPHHVSVRRIHGSSQHCQAKIPGPGPKIPRVTKNATELCSSDDVDVVFVLSNDEYHAEHAILALQHVKCVFVEKPVALNLRDIDRIQQAEKSSKGKLWSGTCADTPRPSKAPSMRLEASRRFCTPGYVQTQAQAHPDGLDLPSLDSIGPNSTFVDQSGAFPKAFNGLEGRDVSDRKDRATELVHHALEVECNVLASASAITMWRVLGGLGAHDISAMGEALGMPLGLVGAHTGFSFWRYVLIQAACLCCSIESR